MALNVSAWAIRQPLPSIVIMAALLGVGFASYKKIPITRMPNVDVPVFIRDVSGTPLGMDQPPGSRIQSYSLKVNYSPASAVTSVTFTRAGITTSLTPSRSWPRSRGSSARATRSTARSARSRSSGPG